jgi:HAD superfamily hydrolase (TIGR01509 family)
LSKIRALIFDFDGLILDTEGPEYQSWSEIYREHGCQLDLDVWATCVGTSDVFDPYADLEARYGRPIDRERVRIARRRRNDELLALEALRPGIAGYVAEARERGLKLAVASSSKVPWVEGHLERLGIRPHFDHLSCYDGINPAKPDPYLYRAALAALDVAADEAIAIEDSPNGVLAANRAGIFCIAVPNLLTAQLPLDHADMRLGSLEDLPLEDLLARLEERASKVGI